MAGSSMKAIKLRIKSVESTMQITKAMQLVATSKLRRAKERMENSKPFASVSRETLMEAVSQCDPQITPFMEKREVKNRCYVVIAGERGLAGGYNANVFKAVAAHTGDTPYCVLPIGKKTIDKFQHLHVKLLDESLFHVEGLGVSTCFRLANQLIEGYKNGDFDELVLVYTTFQSMMSQEVRVEQLLPIVKPEDETARNVVTIYEPSPAELLEQVMPDYLGGRLYSAACDSYASEISARRNAMDSATKNAGEMISDLRLKFNRARQGAITQEITEIVAGAEH
ncbi:MAG: ATP synthase F1 subunit gamma [Clostridia bacterium]|nr:ATP synthase F1 subunit gamma [Clostridia bacterium]